MRPGQAESTEAYDRPWKRVSTAALSLGAEEEQPTARVPGAGGCKGLILLRPLNAGRRLFPRKATCGWFWYFCHQKYRESRDDVAGVLYLFSAKRYPKTPRQMPSPTSSRLTLAPGARLKGGFKGRWAAERIISDTTLSLLKPASYAGARAFSRAFVSRLRHRAGVVRRETRREGCVRDKQKAQKPTIAPKGGGWGERNGSKKPAGCRAANNPRRSSRRSQGLGRTKRLKGPAVAGLRRSLPPKDSDTPRARTAECFMYSR